MNRLTRLSLVVGVVVGLAAPALAQDEGGDDSSRKIVYKQKTEIDFEGLDVAGELVKPASALVLDRKKANFNPLIKLRENFNPEMEQSIDEIQ